MVNMSIIHVKSSQEGNKFRRKRSTSGICTLKSRQSTKCLQLSRKVLYLFLSRQRSLSTFEKHPQPSPSGKASECFASRIAKATVCLYNIHMKMKIFKSISLLYPYEAQLNPKTAFHTGFWQCATLKRYSPLNNMPAQIPFVQTQGAFLLIITQLVSCPVFPTFSR